MRRLRVCVPLLLVMACEARGESATTGGSASGAALGSTSEKITSLRV